jgi:hypothetical protein
MSEIKMPKRLYKYAEIDNKLISSMVDRYSWYAAPQTFNDPFDCTWHWNKELSEKLSNRRVLCLAASHNTLLMWSHYCNSHKGVCLEFEALTDETLNLQKVQQILNPEGAHKDALPIIQNFKPVQYLREDQINERIVEAISAIDDGDLPAERIEELLLTKHIDWAYEKEYRMMVSGVNHVHHPGILTRVYVGMNASKTACRLLHGIVDIVSKQQIEHYGTAERIRMFKMERVANGYGLQTYPLTAADVEIPGLTPIEFNARATD